MPFELGAAINRAAVAATDNPLSRRVFGNPVYTAVVITTIIVVMFLGLFRKELRSVSNRRKISFGIYTFLGMSIIAFLHNAVVARILGQRVADDGLRSVVRAVTGGAAKAMLPRATPVSLSSTIALEDVNL